jgi:hypothetical protein
MSRQFQRSLTLCIIAVIGMVMVWLLVSLPPAVRALDDENGTLEIIDNSQADFADGVFQRTVVAASPESPSNPDVVGAVELAPAGALNRNNWIEAPARLPQPLSDAPVVSLGRYLFVIGGATTSNSGGDSRSSYIYRGVVNQATGSLETRNPVPPGNDAFTAFEIPAVYPGPECNSNISLAGRSRAGAVAVPATTGSNLGYIFIIGGSMYDQRCTAYDFSTNIVQRATVDANGNIVASGWSAPNNWRFPTLDINGNIITNTASPDLRGIQNVQVVHVRTSNGTDYIYAIGGLSIAPSQFLKEDIYIHTSSIQKLIVTAISSIRPTLARRPYGLGSLTFRLQSTLARQLLPVLPASKVGRRYRKMLSSC